jgi:hypothetical protein
MAIVPVSLARVAPRSTRHTVRAEYTDRMLIIGERHGLRP